MTTPAIGRGALPGWWRIISFHLEFEDSDQRLNLFGVDPLGHVVIVDDRIVSIITSRDRADKDDASLFETMMAYSGAYHVEDEVKLVIKVDAAWHPAWVGTEQVRFFKIDADALSITTAWQTHPKFPGRTARGVLTAQRL